LINGWKTYFFIFFKGTAIDLLELKLRLKYMEKENREGQFMHKEKEH